ncbi:hypothetical protein [Arthrobacter sp. A2-55]|uniref:hypothetical protein n=1 Tax=Arthrobacter sp. A2-55 TaxID=2897337 RepID=UPI0021CDDCD8|nr:hypothetical protein [Arthrobacter sp. A2-55]MCU6480529.1 hypothetical protein [Arthrobacter sp. A2-55]
MMGRMTVPDSPKYPLGTMVPSRSTDISALEVQVRVALESTGAKFLPERMSIQCGLEPARGNFPLLTPDLIVSGALVCVEIDSEYTHGDRNEVDQSRNLLLAGLGWTVVRLRLGGLPPVGEHDVICEASTPSKAAIEALAAAVADAVAGTPGAVRKIHKKAAVVSKSQKSRLGAMAEHKYHENAFYAGWTTESGEKLALVVTAGGRYLSVDMGGRGLHFIRHLDLHTRDRKTWRSELIRVLKEQELTSFEPSSIYPWGDTLFIGAQADALQTTLKKFNPGGSDFAFTANLEGPDEFNDESVLKDGSVLASLHPEACEIGWSISDVRLHAGRNGPYQSILLVRDSHV